jgi:DNA-binding GntR family transcriptional regulator
VEWAISTGFPSASWERVSTVSAGRWRGINSTLASSRLGRRAPLIADYTSGSVRQFLAERQLPLTRTFSLIGARLPSREEASVLLMPRHLPALTVLTLSHDALGNPVEIAHSTSRSDRFQYQIVT